MQSDNNHNRKRQGERFRECRKYQALTQSAIGISLGLSKKQIVSIEKGLEAIPPETLEEMKILFAINPNYITSDQPSSLLVPVLP